MAYKDILPTTNLSAVDIRDTLGCNSNNLALYCVGDKSGGYAFKVLENDGTPDDGYLVGEPYFNIYSQNAPGEWVHSGDYIFYQLKRNTYGDVVIGSNTFTSTSYCYDLGSFVGYTHSSRAPTGSSIITQNLTSTSSYNIGIYGFDQGDYDWASIVSSDTAPRSDLYYALSWDYTGISLPLTDDYMKQVDDISQSIYVEVFNTAGIPTLNSPISVRMGLYKKVGTDTYRPLFYLPIETSTDGNLGSTFSVEMTVKTNNDAYYEAPSVGAIAFYDNTGSLYTYDFYLVSISSTASGDSVTFGAYYGTDTNYGIKLTVGSITYVNNNNTYSSNDTVTIRQSTNTSNYAYLYYISGTITGTGDLQGGILLNLTIL